MPSIFVLLFAAALATVAEPARAAGYRFAFGGCNFQRLAQTHWQTIGADAPALWEWNGDIIYADGSTMATRRQEYSHLKNNRFYAAFRAVTRIVGVWDDHDFDADNASGAFADKVESQRALLDFLDEPADSARRRQEGVYASYRIGGDVGKARLVLLDGRYFRERPGASADMLGETQWRWLEAELEDVRASGDEAVFLVSGSQVLPDDTGADSWAEYPKARRRLFDRLARVDVPVVFLSGDRHHAEFSRLEVGGRVYLEATSSGLTHGAFHETPNRLRVGSLYIGRNYGVVDLERKDGRLSATIALKRIDGTTASRLEVF
jgi:alkaline phosphatase D